MDRRRRALAAAAALRGENLAPATALLQSWRFASEPALCVPFLQHLARAPIQPEREAHAVWLGDLYLAPPDADRPERAWLRDLSRYVSFDTPSDPLAWALAALSWWGEEVQDLERQSWADRRMPASAVQDAAAGGLWAAWFSGDLGRVWKGWEPVYWPAGRRALRAALVARNVPEPEHRRIRTETLESFLLLFLGERGKPPGWRELAVRVVEGGGADGPITALARLVEPARWAAFFRCAHRKQPWRGTAARLHPGPLEEGPFEHAWTASEPARLELLLDLHAAHRLVRAWRYPPSCGVEPSWRVLRHHRHRVRGRLRAVVRDQPGPRLSQALFAADGLHARTEAAVGNYVWTWAQSELKHRFAVEPRVLTPTCVQPEGPAGRGARADTDAILAIERAWVGLVFLRGKADLLRLYLVQRFKTNGSLGELFALLPDAVADPDTAHNRTWNALRRSLRLRLPDYEAALRPRFVQLAALDPEARGLKRQALALLTPGWPEALALPRGGFPHMVRTARSLAGAP